LRVTDKTGHHAAIFVCSLRSWMLWKLAKLTSPAEWSFRESATILKNVSAEWPRAWISSKCLSGGWATEFSPFRPADLEGYDFVGALDFFFGTLPRVWNYSVEVRNESLLQPAYFAMLQKHNVAHTFNSWARMPPVTEQIRLAGSELGSFTTGRFLLRPGRSYDEAVDSFKPYEKIQDPYGNQRGRGIGAMGGSPSCATINARQRRKSA
jgi:Protein of unknown function DUF72